MFSTLTVFLFQNKICIKINKKYLIFGNKNFRNQLLKEYNKYSFSRTSAYIRFYCNKNEY